MSYVCFRYNLRHKFAGAVCTRSALRCALSPDGKVLCAGSEDGQVRFWSTENGAFRSSSITWSNHTFLAILYICRR